MLIGNAKKTAKVLPMLVEQARENFPGDVNRQRTAVLLAWINLAGIPGWQPEMVGKVEKALRLFALLVVCVALGHGATTTVAQTQIGAPDAQHLATGTITITATAPFTAADGVRVEMTPLTVEIRNGAFSVNLEPNDTGTPAGTQYVAVWALDGARSRTERWVVITSGSTLAVGDVVATVIAPTGVVQPGQIAQHGATAGQTLVWSGSTWLPGAVTGGSGGSAGPNIAGSSNVTAVTASQSPVVIGSGLTAAHYAVRYYASVNTPCTAGAESVSFQFTWTDAAARSLTTGSLVMGSSSQNSQGYLSGLFELYAGAGTNVAYVSTVAGGCLTGTASYDVHAVLEQIQ